MAHLVLEVVYSQRVSLVKNNSKDTSVLPFDPANRAELLIRLGRFEDAGRGLEFPGNSSNDELRWRLAAVGALALRAPGQSGPTNEMSGRAHEALTRLRLNWLSSVAAYEKRPDVAGLTARLVAN